MGRYCSTNEGAEKWGSSTVIWPAGALKVQKMQSTGNYDQEMIHTESDEIRDTDTGRRKMKEKRWIKGEEERKG